VAYKILHSGNWIQFKPASKGRICFWNQYQNTLYKLWFPQQRRNYARSKYGLYAVIDILCEIENIADSGSYKKQLMIKK